MLNESSSSMALIYSPDNLAAELLTDKKEQTREQKIAIARLANANKCKLTLDRDYSII